MDTTIIFALVLSACFIGGIVWIVVYSRRRQSAALRAQRQEGPGGENVRPRRAGAGDKTG